MEVILQTSMIWSKPSNGYNVDNPMDKKTHIIKREREYSNPCKQAEFLLYNSILQVNILIKSMFPV